MILFIEKSRKGKTNLCGQKSEQHLPVAGVGVDWKGAQGNFLGTGNIPYLDLGGMSVMSVYICQN